MKPHVTIPCVVCGQPVVQTAVPAERAWCSEVHYEVWKTGRITFSVWDSIRESNRIEGIYREPTGAEVEEYHRFMAQDEVTLKDMVQFVSVYQPGADLRDRKGLDVRIGNHFPPPGDITVKTRLIDILAAANRCRMMFDGRAMGPEAYAVHHRYETLHPFTDGNGRSGRMLWMWMMREAPLGFLHTWYYQSLSAGR